MGARRVRENLPRRARALLAAATIAAGCSYDFDQFVHGGAGGTSTDNGGAGHGGTSTVAGRAGNAGSSSAGRGGTGGTAEGGEAGAGGSPSDAMGGTGTSGSGTGGSGTSGTGTSGAGTSAGRGGTAAGGAGAGGKPSSAGQGGARPSAGSAGTTSSSGGAGSTCSGTTYGGHCYFVVGQDTGLDWPSAKAACEAYSKTTHLVTITSASEQAALVQAFFPATIDTWIGLSLADPTKSPDSICKLSPSQCPFKWVTGEKLDYTDWLMRSSTDQEPNYSGSCVRIPASEQTWADTGCTGSKYRAICEDG